MPIEAGSLRDRVTIREPFEEATGLGETIVDYKDWKSVWAEVRSISAQDIIQMQQQTLVVTHVVTIRHLPGLSTGHRVRYRGKDMEIQSVLDRENRTIHELVCREITVQ